MQEASPVEIEPRSCELMTVIENDNFNQQTRYSSPHYVSPPALTPPASQQIILP